MTYLFCHHLPNMLLELAPDEESAWACDTPIDFRQRPCAVASLPRTAITRRSPYLALSRVLIHTIAIVCPALPFLQVMTPNPECAQLNTTIVDAMHTMHDGKFLHLPVIDRGE